MKSTIKNKICDFEPKHIVNEHEIEKRISQNQNSLPNTMKSQKNIQKGITTLNGAEKKKIKDKEDFNIKEKEDFNIKQENEIIENKIDEKLTEIKEIPTPIIYYEMKKEEKFKPLFKNEKIKTRGVSRPQIEEENNNIEKNTSYEEEKTQDLEEREFKINNEIIKFTNKQIRDIQSLFSQNGHTIKFQKFITIAEKLKIKIKEDNGNGDKRHIKFNGRSSLWWKPHPAEIGHVLHKLIRSDFENKFGLKKEIFDK